MASARAMDLEANLPVDAEPALIADVAVLGAAGALSTIHDAKRSGLILFRQRQHEKRIYLDAGEVIFASSNQAVDRLGECLLRSGAITLDELRRVESQFQAGDRFGRVLVESGVLTPRELWNGVRNQVEEIVRSLFAAPSGRLWFWEGDIRPDNVVRLSLDTPRLITEGQQRCAELRRFLTVLEDPRVQLARTGLAPAASLAESERAICEAVRAGRSFADVVGELGIERESAARSVQLLRLVGAVKLMRLPDLTPATPRDPALAGRAEALVKLVTALLGEVMRADGDGEARKRLARELHDVAGRFPALLAGVEIAEEGDALDVEGLVERAAHLPDEGGDVLATALGELITYLEFELMNHPKLRDPAAFLRGLEPLRRAAAA
jgi:hypothetical protein